MMCTEYLWIKNSLILKFKRLVFHTSKSPIIQVCECVCVCLCVCVIGKFSTITFSVMTYILNFITSILFHVCLLAILSIFFFFSQQLWNVALLYPLLNGRILILMEMLWAFNLWVWFGFFMLWKYIFRKQSLYQD